jgi:hypothetical protein
MGVNNLLEKSDIQITSCLRQLIVKRSFAFSFSDMLDIVAKYVFAENADGKDKQVCSSETNPSGFGARRLSVLH